MSPVDVEMKDASAPLGAKDMLKDQERRKIDFSDELAVEVPAATEMANSGLLAEAIVRLLALEKKARLASDVKTVVEVALVIIKLCRKHEDWKELIANISLLCKRRQQFKQVQSKVIAESAEYVDSTPSEKVKLELIEVLRTVSEGKIFVEVERARLTMKLAMIEEKNGEVDKAAAVLQEEQVETYGGMDKREKMNYLLEQVRLVLKKKDFIRAFIISNKISKASIEDPELEDLKIKYYNLLIEYYTHEKDAMELAKCYMAIYRCKLVQDDEAKWQEQLKLTVIYLALAPFDNHQIDLVHIMLQDKKLKSLSSYYGLLKHFATSEVAPWPLPENAELVKHPLMNPNKMSDDDDEVDWYQRLRDRIMEHDIRIVAKYYTRIRTARLAGFLQLSTDRTEEYVADMVTTGTIRLSAKIDRPAGIISFEPKKDANAHLSDWAEDIGELLNLVEKTCHLIHKENMVHQVKA